MEQLAGTVIQNCKARIMKRERGRETEKLVRPPAMSVPPSQPQTECLPRGSGLSPGGRQHTGVGRSIEY